jgi:steroid 5-alpha reductase family enzyme
MAYNNGNAPSIGSKLSLLVLTLFGVVFGTIYLTGNSRAETVHYYLLLSCTVIFFVRLFISVFVFIKRKVSWFEGISVGILYGLMVSLFSVWGTTNGSDAFYYEIAGAVLFCLGSFINSLSDYQRYMWKKQPSSKGHLYTQGLFRYAMHINFFGDSLMFVGYAMVTRNALSFIPVLFIILNFIFIQIPQLDDYLKEKYKNDFEQFSKKNKKFIPFIY